MNLRKKTQYDKFVPQKSSIIFSDFFEILSLIGKPLFLLLKCTIVFAIKLNSLFRLKQKKAFTAIIFYPKKLGIYILKLLIAVNRLFAIMLRKKILSILVVIILVGAFSVYYIVFRTLPKARNLTSRDVDVSTIIYDRNGVVLYKIYKDENRTLTSLSKIPKHTILATLAIEDAEFYQHPGFSIRGIIRSIFRNAKRGQLTGGSTITQQLVKNALLSSEKTFERKVREFVLAIKVEMVYTKDEILEMYLNEVAYGGTTYGIQEASQTYFGKNVSELSLAESALLAGLPKSPSTYSPFGANPQKAISRQHQVLKLMETNGYISPTQREIAEKERLTFAENKTNIKAPHFVMLVRQQLEKIYGKEVVEKGGLNVETTLDYNIQKLAEKIVSEEIDKIRKLNVNNGAIIVMNPQNGEILAMVGSVNYFDTNSDGNVNVTTSERQPGSSIKVVNYAYALSNGLTPATIVKDIPTVFSVAGQPEYRPKNYDGQFRGNITLRNALAQSRNVPAVRILSKYGVERMIELGKLLGITTWNNSDNYGLSLTLGGGEVRLVDLATVYATIANYGKRTNLKSIEKITNYRGNTLEEHLCSNNPSLDRLKIAFDVQAKSVKRNKSTTPCESEQVLDPRVAFIITDILKDNEARSRAFGTNSLLNINGHKEVAVKTGTSNNLRDNLAIGYNQEYLVAVWVGNNDNSSMNRIASGITGATPIFNRIMESLLAEKANHNWEIPKGLIPLPICTTTGTLTCKGCPKTKMEWFLEENTPTTSCNEHWFEKTEGEILPESANTEE